MPPVTAPALKECPAPATRTGPGPWAIARASSARVVGRSNRSGVARWEPDQLTHSTTTHGTVR